MNDILLQIGSLDVSHLVDRERFSVTMAAVYEQGFKNMLGVTKKAYLGMSYKISTTFENVDNDKKNEIIQACKGESVMITFDGGGEVEAEFNHPDIGLQLNYEDDNRKKVWTISFSAVCDLAPHGL